MRALSLNKPVDVATRVPRIASTGALPVVYLKLAVDTVVQARFALSRTVAETPISAPGYASLRMFVILGGA